MRTRYLVYVAAMLAPSVVSAQLADADWRAHFAAGEEARTSGDHAAYAASMSAAARALPDGLLNRPFVQYHAARAAALAGREDEAIGWLRMAWEEDIEALMISFARFDPAFGAVRGGAAFEEVMGLASTMRIEVDGVGGAVHLLRGAGSNVVAQIGEDGVLLVDTGYGPALPALRRALRELGAERVDLLVVTHPHEDHMGGTPELGADALVLAHPGTAEAMSEPYTFMEGVDIPPKPRAALPDRRVARDTTFHFNGEEVRIVPMVAHTEGDVAVHFVGSGVVHLGDTYLAGNPMMFPGTDDPDGFLDRVDAFLEGLDESTAIVSGHDPVATVADVRAQLAVTRACMAYVRSAVARGRSVEEATADAPERFGAPWIAFFYRLLSQADRHPGL